MFLQVDTLSIRLSSDSQALHDYWAECFRGWIGRSPAATPPDEPLSLHLDVRPELPQPPGISPLFIDHQQRVIVYEPEPGHFVLRFPAGAQVQVTTSGEGQHGARGVIHPRLVDNPLLTDVLYTSLSPLLRRRQYFLVHAAAVRSAEGKATLFVGPTQSGKTTSSLALFLAGWGYLASDVVLLRAGEDAIDACPTPGEVHVRPHTFALLPQLVRYADGDDQDSDVCLTLPQPEWGAPAPVTAILFPELGDEPQSRLTPLSQAVALGRLVEESADRWDSAYLQAHLQFLARLVRQAPAHRLQLAHNVIDLPQLIDPGDC